MIPKLNIKRLRTLYKFFKKADEARINQNIWCRTNKDKETIKEASQDGCGTVACVAGHTVLMWGPRKWVLQYNGWSATLLYDGKGGHRCFSVEAQKLLGLTKTESSRLFAQNHTFDTDKTVILQRIGRLLLPTYKREL